MPIRVGTQEVARRYFGGREISKRYFGSTLVFARAGLPQFTSFTIAPDHVSAGADPVTPTLTWQESGGTSFELTGNGVAIPVSTGTNTKLIEPAPTQDVVYVGKVLNAFGNVERQVEFLYNTSGANVANFTAGAVSTHQGPSYELGHVVLQIGITGHPFPTLSMPLPANVTENRRPQSVITEANPIGTVTVSRFLSAHPRTDTLTLTAQNRFGTHSRSVTIQWPGRG